MIIDESVPFDFDLKAYHRNISEVYCIIKDAGFIPLGRDELEFHKAAVLPNAVDRFFYLHMNRLEFIAFFGIALYFIFAIIIGVRYTLGVGEHILIPQISYWIIAVGLFPSLIILHVLEKINNALPKWHSVPRIKNNERYTELYRMIDEKSTETPILLRGISNGLNTIVEINIDEETIYCY